MEINQDIHTSSDRQQWNNHMYMKYPTPFCGVGGIINRARIQAILNLAEINSNTSVLEVGCEAGNLLAKIHKAKRIVGIDISDKALHDAAKHFADRESCPELLQLDVQEPLPFYVGEFDVIICSEVIEHLSNPKKVIENIRRISTSNTIIIISVPLERNIMFIKKLLYYIGLFKHICKGIQLKHSEWHIQSFSKKSLNNLLSDYFEIKRRKTVWNLIYVVLVKKREVGIR